MIGDFGIFIQEVDGLRFVLAIEGQYIGFLPDLRVWIEDMEYILPREAWVYQKMVESSKNPPSWFVPELADQEIRKRGFSLVIPRSDLVEKIKVGTL